MVDQGSEVKGKLFTFLDYKSYLKEWIRAFPHKGRGMKSELARAAQCQTAYLSRVIERDAHLSLEQAMAIQPVLAHSRDESKYFLLLVQLARAGTSVLRTHFEKEIEEARRAHADLKSRFQVRDVLSEQDQATYYSSYQYGAVHASVSVPEFQSIDALEKQLRISRQRLQEILDFLVSCGILELQQGRYKIGDRRLHLSRGSPLIRQHHTNWRVEALRSLERGSGASGPDDLHYSAVVSLSLEGCFRLKELWVKTLETFNQEISRTPKIEAVRCLALDFFGL